MKFLKEKFCVSRGFTKQNCSSLFNRSLEVCIDAFTNFQEHQELVWKIEKKLIVLVTLQEAAGLICEMRLFTTFMICFCIILQKQLAVYYGSFVSHRKQWFNFFPIGLIYMSIKLKLFKLMTVWEYAAFIIEILSSRIYDNHNWIIYFQNHIIDNILKNELILPVVF